MNHIAQIETQKDYITSIIICLLFFLASKNAIPIFVYTIPTLIGAFYFFPLRLLMSQNKNFTGIRRVLFITNSITFSSLLVFSILQLYINESAFFRSLVVFLSFCNIALMMFFYLKFNKFLLLNFIFSFLLSMLLF